MAYLNKTFKIPACRIRLILMFTVLLILPLFFLNITAAAVYTVKEFQSGQFQSSTPEESGLNPEDIKKFSGTVEKLVSEKQIIGGEILIIKNKKTVLHETYGWSDRERKKPLEKNSIYRIRSMTKPFIGTSILILEQEGRLKLDDPVSRYLSSYKNDKSGKITIRQLITHTTGFKQDAFPSGYWETGNLRDAVDVLGKNGPPDPPDGIYRYSDKNSATMGAIIAELTDEPCENFIRKRILEPLGMKDTFSFFSPDFPWAERMNSTYRRRGGSINKYWNPKLNQMAPFFRASGGLYTTVSDYARFLSVWMDYSKYENGRLLKKPAVIKALKKQKADYGFHWEVFGETDSSGSLPPFGHGGSDGTFAIAIPVKNIMVLYFTQTRGTPTIRRNILPLVEKVFIKQTE